MTGKLRRRVLGRSAIRFRVYLLLAVGVLGPAALLTLAFLARLSDLDARQIAGQQYAASAVAGQLDQELSQVLETLQRAASAPHVDLEDRSPEAERAALRDPYLHSVFPGGVFMLDARGEPLAEEPDRGERSIAPPSGTPEVQETLSSGRPVVTSLVSTPSGAHVYAMVPVRNWQGRVSGLAGGVIEPGQRHFTVLLHFLLRGPEGRAEIVDRAGMVLAAADPERARHPTECRGAVGLIRERRGDAARCGACHGGRKGGDRWRAILAVAPLSAAPWGVVLREPEREVLASPGALPLSLASLGLAMLVLGAAFAWGAARSVTQPVAALTAAAERIAGGDLAEPIPFLGDDEVGRLGRSLERMRGSLRQTIGYAEQANAELEKRVAERTAELEQVNARLREREQTLAQLYGKVVSAQEDERKRIARELHDETSQSLAVLAMGIESASAALKAGLTPRLEEVKALAVRTIDEVHRLILDLRPSVLDDLGLLSAIRWYAERYLESRGIAVRCEFEKLERRLPPAFETAVFRVCQEAMSNVARHARAETLLVQVGAKGEALHIEIEDDGMGFDPAAAAADTRRPSFGLLGIRERVELLGGRFRVDSAPGKGTRIQIEVPLPREA